MASSSSSQAYPGPPDYGMELPYELYRSPPGEKTFQYQDSLPSLPVPDLDFTMKKYLESLQPFLSSQEMKRSEAIVKDFANGVGKILHQKLAEKAKNNRNWLAEWWDDYAYLYRREPHVPDINILGPAPYHMFMWPPKEGTQCERAALSSWFTLKYWEMVRKETLKVDRNSHKDPFCMNQMRRVLNYCKTPGELKDATNYYFRTDREGGCPSHVCVLCRGRMFRFDVLDENGDILTAPELQLQFQRIRDWCDSKEEWGPNVGVLTADHRVTWYKARQHLLELHPDNQRHLDDIQQSVMLISLEDFPVEDYSELSLQGFAGNGWNRWFDKGFTLIVFTNGMVSCNCDHTPAEGMVCIIMSHFNLLGLQKCNGKWLGTPLIRPQPLPTEIIFHLDGKALDDINHARQIFQKNASNIEVMNGFFREFGKTFIRKHKLHPDAFVQVALQCAYYRKHGKPAPTYETATIRKYYLGRTETVRSCTSEAVDFSKAMVDPCASKAKRLELMKIAVHKHAQMLVDCSDLKGCDRHLLALQILAMENDIPIPDLYKDPAYTKSGGGGNYTLSTSFLGYTPCFGGTAPMCKDGYGFFYSIPNDGVNAFIASWKVDEETNCKGFYDSFTKTLLEMKDLLSFSQDQAKL